MKALRLVRAGFVVAVLRPKPDLSQLNTAFSVSFRALKPLAVMVCGAPGSGKGTFGRLLSQLTGWPHISTGDLLRKHITADTELGQASIAILDGQYAPDRIANQLVSDRIQLADCHDSFILDGYPRTLPQCLALLPMLQRWQIEPIVVRLQLDRQAVRSRLLARVTCSCCGTSFNLVSFPPSQAGRCDECGSLLATRTDDQASLIDKRIDFYDELTGPVEKYLLESAFRCRQMDASLEPKVIVSEFVNGLLGDSLVTKSYSSVS